MNKYAAQIREIEERKDDMAKAIALGLSDGNLEKAKEYYEIFKKTIVNDTKYFFLEVSDFQTQYMVEVNSMVDKLNAVIGKDIRPYLFGNIAVASGSNIAGVVKSKKTKIEKIYDKYENEYKSLGIDKNDIQRVYNQGGMRKIDELNKLIKQVKSKTFMMEHKNILSSIKDSLKQKPMTKALERLNSKYHIGQIDDLLKINTEIDSFLIDTSKLSKEQRSLVEENRNSYRSRIGENEDYFINKQEAIKIKKDINTIYNYNMFKQMSNNTNIEDFFRTNDIEYNQKNVNDVISIMFTTMGATGSSTYLDTGRGGVNYCMLNSFLLDSSADKVTDVVIHETIHALEQRNKKSKETFCGKYRNINEAMTEYFTLKAMKYFKGNVLKSTENNPKKDWQSGYNNMLPCVEVLESSGLFEYFINAKFYGEVEALENKVGIDNMKKISKCFDKAAKLEINDYRNQQKCAEEINEIIKNMKKARVM